MRLDEIIRKACFLNYNYRGEEFMTFDEAARVLHDELNYPQDRALNFVRRFDRNNDGRLSVKEFQVMKKRIEETLVSYQTTILKID